MTLALASVFFHRPLKGAKKKTKPKVGCCVFLTSEALAGGHARSLSAAKPQARETKGYAPLAPPLLGGGAWPLFGGLEGAQA